ncbi:MFS general substrate transporter [Fusarium agapanthi]|uniref:MFS general substrate transporter n=1 Tax=Fusarium agapanthi TaxID=1803897 RepID=A0A9P5E5X3_9HYPO|nr:MFS general substrate transporter [Fusarium agapanthi]
MPVPILPLAAWNSHVHCFDPEHYPFKTTRAYTPQPAALKDLIQNSKADNVMLVQATIEDGYEGLLEHLQQCRDVYPNKHARGTIFWDPGNTGLKSLSEFEFEKLHNAGVRSMRIHGSYGGSGDDSISAQLPLTTWSSIAETLSSHPELKDIHIIIDHNAFATPSDINTPVFTSLLHLLSSPNTYIKLGALHRRSTQISQMEHIIKTIANTAPDSIIWGSDWPHCNAAIRGLTPTTSLEVDTDQELGLLRDWLTEEQWEHDVTVFKSTGEEVENVATKQLTLLDTYRSYTPEFSKETEVQLVRKIDLRLLPLIVTIYLFNYLDRNSITQARLYGLQEDTHIKGATYQTDISIFSAGYIMIPAGLLVVRFIFGVVEATFFPGAIHYLSTCYTKMELGIRMALLVCGILLSNCFAGLISAGILSGMAGVGHLAAWRWLFILEGLAAMVIGVVAFFLLPDYPGTTTWLNEEERVVAQGRLAVDAGSEEILGEEEIAMKQAIFSAVRDYRLGFKNNTMVLLLTAPPYLLSFIWALSFAWDADRRQKRCPHAAISGLTAIAATIALVAITDQKWPREHTCKQRFTFRKILLA